MIKTYKTHGLLPKIHVNPEEYGIAYCTSKKLGTTLMSLKLESPTGSKARLVVYSDKDKEAAVDTVAKELAKGWTIVHKNGWKEWIEDINMVDENHREIFGPDGTKTKHEKTLVLFDPSKDEPRTHTVLKTVWKLPEEY